MTFYEELNDYRDGNGLVAPSKVAPGTMRASDNGPLFTAEALLAMPPFLSAGPRDLWNPAALWMAIKGCIGADGELHRAPGDDSPDEIDDYLGVYAAVLHQGLHGNAPRLPLRLWRFPQLIYLRLLTSGSVFLYHFLSPIIALIILTSCLGVDKSDSNSRCLGWLLCTATTPHSILCSLASKVWFKRLLKTYPGGMKDVYTIYFGADHPLTKIMGTGGFYEA